VGIDIDISEVRAISSRLATAGGRVGVKAAAALTKTAYDIEADAKANCVRMDAVDTGDMMNSITTEITGDGRFGAMAAEIGPTVDYAIYVHEGTSVMAPRPYLGEAFDRRMPPYMAALGDIAAEETL